MCLKSVVMMWMRVDYSQHAEVNLNRLFIREEQVDFESPRHRGIDKKYFEWKKKIDSSKDSPKCMVPTYLPL
jgi:hypothetical protein